MHRDWFGGVQQWRCVTMRDDARRLVDELLEEALPSLLRLLRGLRADPLAGLPDWVVHVPEDDEELNEAGRGTLAEAEAGIARGEPSIPADKVWSELLG